MCLFYMCICFIFVFVLYVYLFYICVCFIFVTCFLIQSYRSRSCTVLLSPSGWLIAGLQTTQRKKKIIQRKKKNYSYIIAQNMRIFSKFVSGWEDGTLQPKLHQILFMIAPFSLITILIHNLWLRHFTFTFHIKSTMLFQHLWLSIFTFSFHFYVDLSVYFHLSSFPDIKFVKSLKLGWFKKYENS